MKLSVPFDDRGNLAIQRTTASSHNLQNPGALPLRFECAFNDLHLSLNPSNTRQKLFFLNGHMSHEAIILYYSIL